MRKLLFQRFRRKASSLVVTLLVIVVLSTIIVAFMQSMAIERLTARSLKNIVQAELAAQAGYEAAVRQIEFALGTNSSFVTGQTNYAVGYGPVLLIGRTNLTNTAQLMPLVSSTVSLTNFATPAWSAQLANILTALTNSNSTDVNTRHQYIQRTSNTNYYRASWVPLTNSFGETNARYAYIVLDEHARVNPLLHNGRGTATNATNWFSGPQDVALTNSAAPILSPQEATNLVNMSNQVWTPETFGHAFSARTNYENVKHLLTFTTNATYDVIPGTDRPKYNINVMATNPGFYEPGSTNAAETMGRIIMTNLPQFYSREPSLRTNLSAADQYRYLYRLAANIVDYIDEDSVPTLVNGGEPAGKDLLPLVTAIAQRFVRTAISTETNPASTTIESQCFVQVWNPYTFPISMTGATVRFVLENQMLLRFGTGLVQPFDDYDHSINITTTIQPNEFVVLEFPSVTQTWTSPGPIATFPDNTPTIGNYTGTGSSPNASSRDTADNVTWPTFRFYVNGVLVDMQRRPPVGPGTATGGLSMNRGKKFDSSSIRYSCYFLPTEPNSFPLRSVGDPRANFLTTYDWVYVGETSYGANTRWKGRQMDTRPRYQKFVEHWINRDYVRANPSMGAAPGNINTTPAQVASAYNAAADGPAAIAFLRNGPMQAIGELGNVFDPIQADDNLAAPNGGTPSSPYISAGGRTLRIGQPEFTVTGTNNWNTNGRRAIELLDVFTVNWTNSTSGGWPVGIGKINPNTAPPEVLSAILSSITIRSDTGISTAVLTNVGTIASNIVLNRPYEKLSDLHRVLTNFSTATNYHPAFGSSVGGGTTNLAALDRVREEAFAKFAENLAIQSRTYRIFVLGETLDRGRVRSRSALETIVHFRTNSAGAFYPVVQYQKFHQ